MHEAPSRVDGRPSLHATIAASAPRRGRTRRRPLGQSLGQTWPHWAERAGSTASARRSIYGYLQGFLTRPRRKRLASHARGRWFETSRAHSPKVLVVGVSRGFLSGASRGVGTTRLGRWANRWANREGEAAAPGAATQPAEAMATPERTGPAASAAVYAHGGGCANAMAPRASGAIETHARRDGRTVTIRARVRAYGRRYRIDFGTTTRAGASSEHVSSSTASSSRSSAAPGSRQAGTETRGRRSTPRRRCT